MRYGTISPRKTEYLPSVLPQAARQREFAARTLGLWSSGDFVIYYQDGRVPQPGIGILGKIESNMSIFNRPGEATVGISRAD